ncbi:MAG: oligosaccharide flippase family protein [Gammaproteobacteria bacterium]|nr:oligosaccharide flippase family protein [Gammaproteobacteria bacterium]
MSAVIAYVAVLSPFIVLGLPALFSTDFHRLERSELNRKSTVWLVLPLAIGGALTISAWALSDYLAEPLAMPSAWVPVIPCLALLGFIPQWASVMFQMDNRPRHFAAYQAAQGLSLMATAILFVALLNMHWEGRLWSMLIVGGLASIAGFLALRPFISFSTPRKDDVNEAVKFGAGLLPHSVLSQIIRQSDRLFILHFIGLAAAGEYAVGWQVASIMLVLLSTFNQAWTPYLFQNLANADELSKCKIVRLSYGIALGFVALFLAVNLASPVIFSTLISSKYQEAQRFVPYIALGYLFLGFYTLVTDYIFYTKKTYLFSILTTASAVINIAMNYVFIERFGAVGVAYAFAISSAIVTIAAWLLAHKVYPMPWMSIFTRVRSV